MTRCARVEERLGRASTSSRTIPTYRDARPVGHNGRDCLVIHRRQYERTVPLGRPQAPSRVPATSRARPSKGLGAAFPGSIRLRRGTLARIVVRLPMPTRAGHSRLNTRSDERARAQSALSASLRRCPTSTPIISSRPMSGELVGRQRPSARRAFFDKRPALNAD